MARRVLIMTATIHAAGVLRDCSADYFLLDDCKLVFDTGEFPKCLKKGGDWAYSEPIGDGVEVLRGAVVHIIPIPES